MIDKTILNKEIREAAEVLLSDIQTMSPDVLEENLKYFAEKAKDIAERVLDEYSNEKFDYYTDGAFGIKDPDVLRAFVDFNTGYKQQMLNWIESHRPEVKEEHFEIVPPQVEEKMSFDVSPRIILGVGTAIAVGLFIFTNIWIALAAEILAIVMGEVQKRRISNRKTMLENEEKRYKATLLVKKDALINGMINELDKWLEEGEAYSESIIKSFGL